MNKEHGWPAPGEDRTGNEAGPDRAGEPAEGPEPAPEHPAYGSGPGFAPPGFAPPGGFGQGPAGYSAPAAYGGPGGPGGPGAPGGYGSPGGPGGFGPGQGPGPGGPAGYGNGPGYGSYPPRTPGKGLAIAALCVAGFGLLFSWIWFLNFITFLTGLVALGLGIPALVKGIKARNAARPLSIAALSIAVVSMIVAVIINVTVQYGFPDEDEGYAQGEAPMPVLTETPAPPSAPPSASPAGPARDTEPKKQPGLPDKDYSGDISGPYFDELIQQPAASAGEGVQVGDYTVTLTEVDREASAEVLERDPSAGEPTHGYVLFEFGVVYNGSSSTTSTGRPDLDFTPKFIGSDERLHSVLNCSMDFGVSSSDRPRLAPGESGIYEICFDLPEAALAEDSRVGLRMILADHNEDVYWRLP